MSRSRVYTWGVAIVAGIFLVFAIDTWWQDRQVSFEEQQVLQDLNEEFTSLHKVLTRHLADHSRTLESLQNVLLEIENGPSKDVGPIMDSALLEMTSLVTWDRDEGSLDALLGSGRTNILTNSRLREKLSTWDGVFGEFLGDQQIANEVVHEIHNPYFLSKNVAIDAAISNDPDAILRLLEDPKFHVLAEVRYRFKEHLIVEVEIAIAAAEAILVELEKPSD